MVVVKMLMQKVANENDSCAFLSLPYRPTPYLASRDLLAEITGTHHAQSSHCKRLQKVILRG